MKKKPEQSLQDRAFDIMRGLGWSADHCESAGRPGFPDGLFMQGGRAILVEFKSGTELRESQKSFAVDLWLKNGVTVYCIEEGAGVGFVLSRVIDHTIIQTATTYAHTVHTLEECFSRILSTPEGGPPWRTPI